MDLYVPSVPEQYGVNVNTVRKGTVVRDRPPIKRLGTDRYAKSKWKFGLVAFAADREASGQTWKRDDQTNTVRELLADKDVAEALGVESGAPGCCDHATAAAMVTVACPVSSR
jgi:GntR family transcriptional regulator